MQSTSVDTLFTISDLGLCSHAAEMSQSMAIACQAALAAGQVVRDGFGSMQKVESKGVGDLVCEVDRMADVAATQVLRRHSTSAILSEELNPDVEPGQGELWIVDPLDGSSAFLVRAGIHFPSVLVALCRDGEPVLGVTLFPLTGEWFYAEKGRGAFKDGQALVIADTDEDLSDVWVEMNQYGDSQYETPIFDSLRRQLRTDRGALLVTISAPNAGVAMRIAESNRLLAAVVHDNNPKSIKQAAWDIAPIKVIFEEAGGVFVNHDGGLVDPFVPEPFVVAKTRRLADQILALL